LYSLFTHDCEAKHDFNAIIKFTDDKTVVGLITDDNETTYREEIRDLAVWCQGNNVSLNVSKTKLLIVDYRKQRGEHAPIHINGAVVERVDSFKLFDVHITKDLSWSNHTERVLKRAQQCLFPLSRLKIFVMGPQILKKVYN
jgi:hypothetical protein